MRVENLAPYQVYTTTVWLDHMAMALFDLAAMELDRYVVSEWLQSCRRILYRVSHRRMLMKRWNRTCNHLLSSYGVLSQALLVLPTPRRDCTARSRTTLLYRSS